MPLPPFGLLGCDARGVVTWSGGAVEALCGCAPGALVGRTLPDALGECDGAARERLADAFEARAPFRLVLGGCAIEGTPTAGKGAPAFCLALRPAPAADAALESEERYRRLVDACPEPIVVHAGGAIRFVNPAGVAMLGAASAEELEGRPVMDFVHPDYRAVVAERMQKMLETGGPALLLEEKIVRPDGSVLEVEIAGAGVLYQGEPAIQLVGRDLTERRRIEAERRRLEDQVREARRREGMLRLAEGVAARLRQLSAELLDAVDESLARPGGRLEPARVRQVGQRMAGLTEQLIGYVGRRCGRAAATNLSSLVLELSEGLEAELDSVASLCFDLPVALPAARVDAVSMRRVVGGLVRNALDALGPRGGRVLVRTRAVDLDEAALAAVQPPGTLRPGRYVALEVRDDGCGMDAATTARVCDPFFSTKSPERGLGLAEAVGLVAAQGGGLAVESTRGRGTTVHLLFPALPTPPTKPRGRWST
jgi:PAS domain S-box-containing protein